MGSISKIWPEILLFTAAILISVAGLNRPAFHGDHELKVALPAHEAVAGGHRQMPDEYINAEGNGITEAFRDYALPLVGRFPRLGWLKGKAI